MTQTPTVTLLSWGAGTSTTSPLEAGLTAPFAPRLLCLAAIPFLLLLLLLFLFCSLTRHPKPTCDSNPPQLTARHQQQQHHAGNWLPTFVPQLSSPSCTQWTSTTIEHPHLPVLYISLVLSLSRPLSVQKRCNMTPTLFSQFPKSFTFTVTRACPVPTKYCILFSETSSGASTNPNVLVGILNRFRLDDCSAGSRSSRQLRLDSLHGMHFLCLLSGLLHHCTMEHKLCCWGRWSSGGSLSREVQAARNSELYGPIHSTREAFIGQKRWAGLLNCNCRDRVLGLTYTTTLVFMDVVFCQFRCNPYYYRTVKTYRLGLSHVTHMIANDLTSHETK